MATQTIKLTLDTLGFGQVVFTPAAPGKYCFFPSAGSPLIGVYQGTDRVGSMGKLRIAPGTIRGVVTLAAVPHLLACLSGTPLAPVSVQYRPWSFWDYFFSRP